MRNKIIRVFLLSLLFAILTGCSATHLGMPAGESQVKDVETEFDLLKDLNYVKRDSGDLAGDLYVPRGAGEFPAVLLIHGGSWAGGDPSMMGSIAKRLASSGFVVFNIHYRLAPEHIFPAQIEDCKDAVRWLRSNADRYKINREKIASFGYSAGGHLAALLGVLPTAETDAAEDSSWHVQAVVAGGAPYNILMYPYNEAVVRLLGTTIDKDPAAFLRASPVHHVSVGDAPVFIYQGTWDDIVDPKHAAEMKEALDKAGVPNEIYLLNGLGHIPTFLFDGGAVASAIDFLNYQLRN